MSIWSQLGLQEGTSVLGVEVQGLYDYSMFIIVMIFSFVVYFMLKVLCHKLTGRVYLDSQGLEVMWTIMPFWLLLALGLPSIKLLYLMDEINLPEASVKVVGHQWYWSYEYSDIRGSSYSYDSYMVSDSSLEGGYRLLEVDNRCVVPTLLTIRGLVTSDDVVHSWAIPSSAIKADGVPGRINQVRLCFIGSGVFYGQCSELCGVNHSFMPICVESVSVEVYSTWIVENHNNVLKGMENKPESWTWWGFLVAAVKGIGKSLYWLGSMYAMFLYYLFYYSFYVTGKFVVVSSWEFMQWAVSSFAAAVSWLVWFSNSPVEAVVYAISYWVAGIWGVVVFVVTKPVMATWWFCKSVCGAVASFAYFTYCVFEAVLNSLTSFTSDGFQDFVVQNVSRNTKKFLWILSNRYK
uniref:Cytochrome c oxidase subunit 2 n=1 Tax=Potomida littoralis TaxID=165005 RepID=A0A0U2UA13_9BIVA|nr:cytochrome c oxidase subunit 2 [Potomida littoralis]